MKPKKSKFDRAMDKLLKEAASTPFKPIAWYNTAGDLIEAMWEDCSYYAQWLNPQVTLLKKQGTDQVVGVQVWALDVDGKNCCIRPVVAGKVKRK